MFLIAVLESFVTDSITPVIFVCFYSLIFPLVLGKIFLLFHMVVHFNWVLVILFVAFLSFLKKVEVCFEVKFL